MKSTRTATPSPPKPKSTAGERAAEGAPADSALREAPGAASSPSAAGASLVPAAVATEAPAAIASLMPLADRPDVLEPHRLAATTEAAARALLRQGEAANTRISYASAMRYWCAWYAARYGAALALPVPVPVVVQFIVDHAVRQAEASEGDAEAFEFADSADVPPPKTSGHRATGAVVKDAVVQGALATGALVTQLPPDIDQALVAAGYKGKLGAPALNTLVHRIAVLSKAHQMAHAGRTGNAEPAGRARALSDPVDAEAEAASFPNPCADPLVRELLARTRRAYAQRGAAPKRQRALTKSPLELLLETCDDSLKGKRDRALLLFGWATGGRRRSEIASATLQNLQRVDAESFIYTLSHSKTNQSGTLRPEDVKPLVGIAAAAMREWLAVLKKNRIEDGAIFRRIRRGGHLGEALAPAAVRDIVKERCALAGVEGSFSAHSLRAGFVTEAGRQNMPLAETMAMTGHQSVATVVGYFRAEAALGSRLGRLFEEG